MQSAFEGHIVAVEDVHNGFDGNLVLNEVGRGLFQKEGVVFHLEAFLIGFRQPLSFEDGTGGNECGQRSQGTDNRQKEHQHGEQPMVVPVAIGLVFFFLVRGLPEAVDHETSSGHAMQGQSGNARLSLTIIKIGFGGQRARTFEKQGTCKRGNKRKRILQVQFLSGSNLNFCHRPSVPQGGPFPRMTRGWDRIQRSRFVQSVRVRLRRRKV